ncbi:hypothetical protein EJ377_17170 [Chryseobacterium arthrosphaerae]|uniref:Uncharacterized protein n=1 Tax=Chryseobacterium arthrosphaerae TaxID=651561 RepID=A0A3S0Q4E9_9FLAO|nr:hypothetical protein EJ377_17170 [Chryseobacterium arthrosphaerae]
MSVEEIATLPHSVALIETAVPVFIGYTELVPAGNNKPLKINSLLDYELLLESKKENIQLKDVEGKGTTLVAPQAKFLMYYSFRCILRMVEARVIFFCRPVSFSRRSLIIITSAGIGNR